jgi:hypothetical protein
LGWLGEQVSNPLIPMGMSWIISGRNGASGGFFSVQAKPIEESLGDRALHGFFFCAHVHKFNEPLGSGCDILLAGRRDYIFRGHIASES